MRPNREKVAFALALVIFVAGVYSLVSTQVKRYPEIETRLSPGDLEFLPVQPRPWVERTAAGRNPFQLPSEWRPVTPAPLEPPPLEAELEPRVFFGWSARHSLGAPILYRARPPVKEPGTGDPLPPGGRSSGSVSPPSEQDSGRGGGS